jgi:Raf kinase inhibitor-like YbhB/YbcL family protein
MLRQYAQFVDRIPSYHLVSSRGILSILKIDFILPADINKLKEDAGNPVKGLAPKGSIQSITDFGAPGFGGACPPPGDKPHRYVFTVYALDVEKLDLDEKTPPAMVGCFLNQHLISKS